MQAPIFYFFSGLAILSSLLVVTLPKPTRALISLIVSMFSLSVLYILLGAPFIAMVLLIVYAGAVLVLFLFVIMLQGIEAKDIPLRERFHPGFIQISLLVGGIFLGLLLAILSVSKSQSAVGVYGTIETIAQALFKNFLLPFELISLLLLLGIFAAISLAKKEEA